ncbi:gas vesicle protein GvpO [Haloprofundus halophilus]|uniref:gas vesicle protein GvpO n=1 Tax=Haloprofundus halophilus TaxID=2283527 RepID=UPI000E44C62E|nr:gas vesicle protein GvpO [Haloprofundus halophilus]
MSTTSEDTGSTAEQRGQYDLDGIRQRAASRTEALTERPLDSVHAVEYDDEAERWRTLVDVVERRSVPDTQDILGVYRIEFDGQGNAVAFERLQRYRRGDRISFAH